MADLMADLKASLSSLLQAKKVFDKASYDVQTASENYQAEQTKVRSLRKQLDESLDAQLDAVGVSSPDSRVHQSE